MKPERAKPIETAVAAIRLSRPYPALLAILFLTLLAYANSFAGVWQFDDYAVLLADARVQSLAAWWQSLPHIRPLFKLSVTLNHESGLGLFGFHLVNLILHGVNTVLVYRIAQELAMKHLPIGSTTAWPVFLVTLVFALHPAQTEAVTYLSGRSVLLEASGLLLAGFALLRFQQCRGRRWRVMMGLGVLVALASRESAVIAPLLLGWLALGRDGHSSAQWQSLRVLWWALGAAALLLLIVLMLPRYRELLWLALQWQDLSALLAIQSQSVLHLLAVATGLTPLNADPALVTAPLASLRGGIAILLPFAAAAFCWRLRHRQPLAIFALGLLFILWLPTHSVFVRLDPVNDRQLYLALPVLTVLVLVLLAPWWRRWTSRKPVVAKAKLVALLLFATLLAAATTIRNQVYSSEMRYWEDVVSKSPHNPRAWNNWGLALAAAGYRADADAAFVMALHLRPDYRKAAANLRLLRAGSPL